MKHNPLDMLTNKQRQVLDLVMLGLSNQEVADALSIHLKTVEAHRSIVMKKLKTKNAVTLTKKYFGIKK